jgi:hypothetical protein
MGDEDITIWSGRLAEYPRLFPSAALSMPWKTARKTRSTVTSPRCGNGTRRASRSHGEHDHKSGDHRTTRHAGPRRSRDMGQSPVFTRRRQQGGLGDQHWRISACVAPMVLGRRGAHERHQRRIDPKSDALDRRGLAAKPGKPPPQPNCPQPSSGCIWISISSASATRTPAPQPTGGSVRRGLAQSHS